ncbi:MAG: ABC transporter permease, partial [Bacillota bacterium]
MSERLGDEGARLKGNLREFGILIAFVSIVIVLMIISPDAFAQPKNLIGIVKQASINGILACGMMFVILSDGIDLSVGSTVALAGVMAAHFAHPDTYPLIVPIL